jgi:hypothetical protein
MHQNLEHKFLGLVITVMEIVNELFDGGDETITDIYVIFWSTLEAIFTPLTLFPIS